MAVPVIASSASFADTSNLTSRTIAKPSGTASGDWLVLAVSIDNSARVVNTPTGFTLVSAILEPGTAHALYLFKRKADGTEGSTFTITSDSEYATGIIHRITGADSTDCVDVLSYGAGELGKSPNARCPNAWSETADALVMRIVASDGGSVSLSTPTGHTLGVYQAGGTSGTSLMTAYKSQATAGYTDSAYSTSGSVTEEYISVTLVIRSTSTASTYPAYPVFRSMVYLMPPTTAPDAYFKQPYGLQSGETLVMMRESDVNNFDTLSGFTNEQSGSTASAVYARLDYKVAGGSEPSTYPGFTTTAGAHVGVLARVVNAHATTPMNTSSIATGTTDAAPTGSSITPSVNNCTLGWFVGADDDDAAYDSGYPSGYTGMISVGNQEAADSSFMFAIKEQTTAAATGSVAGTLDAAEEWVCILFALAPAAASGPTGTASGTEEDDTGSAAGDVFITGTASGAEEHDTGSAAGDVFITGTASGTEEEDSGSASGDVFIAGTASGTEDDDTGSAAGTVADTPITGSASGTEDDDTGSASGTVLVAGTVSASEEDDTGAASGTVAITGSASGTEGDDSGSASGDVFITGTAAGTEDDDSGAASGGAVVTGSASGYEDDDTGSAAGLILITGSASGSEDDDTGSASGASAVSGSASGTENDDTGTAAGLVLVAGTSVGTEEDDTGSAIGTVSGDTETETVTGGWGAGYVHPYQVYSDKEYRRKLAEKSAEEKRLELKRIEDEIAVAEQRRLEKLDAAIAEQRLTAELEASLLEEINRLRMERVWLMRLLDDEEAMFVLMVSRPFH